MGKFKRIARKQTNHHQNPRVGKESGAGTKPDKQQKHSQPLSKAPITTKSPQQARQKVQFSKYDNVLLVGEGERDIRLVDSVPRDDYHKPGCRANSSQATSPSPCRW